MDLSSLLVSAGAGVLVFILAIAVFMIVSLWKIFTKAGQPGWAVLIPIYNLYVFTQVIKRPKWWLLVYVGIYLVALALGNQVPMLALIGMLALLVIQIMDYNRLSKVFGQGVGFTIGLILLSIVFIPLLAFGKYTYENAAVAGPGGPLDQNL